MAGATLFLLLLIEFSLRLFLSVDWLWKFVPNTAIDYRTAADTYQDRSWLGAYYGELRKSNFARWSPYVYWRRKPFSGKYINIDAAGLRVNPAEAIVSPARAADAKKIWMFGGSTLWGTGSRDAFTIPEILRKQLLGKGIACEVKNFGESGYVSTQEVILLLRLLQNGDRPDVVIFYDGVNDTFSSYQQRIAGIPQNEHNRIVEFSRTASGGEGMLGLRAVQDFLSQSATARAIHGVNRRLFGTKSIVSRETRLIDMPPDDRDESLAQKTVALYLGNVKIVEALAKHYKFKALFYWQPTVLQKKHLTAYEQSLLYEQSGEERVFQKKTFAIMKRSVLASKDHCPISYLSDIFADIRDEPLYIDACHLGERGNQIIAERILPDVVALFLENSTRR